MFKKICAIAVLVAISISLTSSDQVASFERVSMDMTTKLAEQGFSNATTAKIFYSFDGKMVSYFYEPKEMVVSNNAKGEMQVYNPKDNTVIQRQNYTYGTETSQLFYFLQNKKHDLGLSDMGFSQSDISFEDGLTITDWLPPIEMLQQISKVRLVHDRDEPIYVAYYDNSDQIGTKSYFYNYIELKPLLKFPSTVTQIRYKNMGKDSTINKTTYSNFRFDNQVDPSRLTLAIPEDVKVLH